MQPRPISHRGLRPSRASQLSCLPLLGALLVLGVRPAHATDLTISSSSPYTGSYPIVVNSGDTLTITGGSVSSGSSHCIDVEGGSVNISGGSVSSDGVALYSQGGTVNISGGSVGGGVWSLYLEGGAASVSGGSLLGTLEMRQGATVTVSGGTLGGAVIGIRVVQATVSVYGCGLQIDDHGFLIGTLADGTPIHAGVQGLTASSLNSTCPADASAPTTTATARADGNPYSPGTWTNTTQGVIVSLNATDPDDTSPGSDVSKITYSATGAQTIASTDAAGASATLPTITAEGITTVSFHATDKAGNAESPDKTFTVQIDKTAPKTTTVSGGTRGSNGWYTGPVSVSFLASDANGSLAVSGVTQTLYSLDDSPFTAYSTRGISISGDGTHTLAFYSIDGAGNIEIQNSASNNLTVNIDSTPPRTTASLAKANAGDPNGSNGWYRGPVNVTLSAEDPASGWASTAYQVDGGPVQTFVFTWTVVAGTPVPATGPPVVTVSGDGTHTVTFWSTDTAGNVEAPQSVTVKIDTTVPALSVGAADGIWHATDVSIPVTASDPTPGSGLAKEADRSFSLTTSVPSGMETSSAATNSQAVSDVAGNSAIAGAVSGIKVDKKAPTITLTTPVAGAVYFLHQTAAASYSVTDGGSGVNAGQSGGPVPSGSNLDTSTVGAHTFTVTGVDNVGNTATPQSASYAVGYQVACLYDQSKYVNSGATVPIKLQLTDANGVNVSSASIVLTALQVTMTGAPTGTVAEAPGNANPDNNFRYDAASNTYQYNLSTKGLASGAYTLSFTAGSDPTLHTVSFQVK
jgi:hypothetical protein